MENITQKSGLKKSYFIILLILAFFTVLTFVGCNKNDEIIISINYNKEISCCVSGIKSMDGNYYTSLTNLFPSDTESYITPNFNFKKGARFDIAPLMYVKVGYKVDRLYYKNNKNNEEVDLYTYKEGDFSSSTGNSLNGYKGLVSWNIEQFITLPDYDITFYVITSQL